MNKIKSLIVGVPYYDDKNIDNLAFCANDSKGVRDVLVKNLKVNKENISIIGEQSKHRSSRVSILRGVNELITKCNEDDILLMYYSGHGALIYDNNYLICSDTQLDLLADTSISISNLYDRLKSSSARFKLLIIDSCHSGVFTKSPFKGNDAFLSPNFEGAQLFASSRASEESFIDYRTKRSIFTHFLIEGLSGYASTIDDNIVTMSELNHYVTLKISAWSSVHGDIQTPTLKGETAGELYFNLDNSSSIVEDKSYASISTNMQAISQFEDYMRNVLNYKDVTTDMYRRNMLRVLGYYEAKSIIWRDIINSDEPIRFLKEYLDNSSLTNSGKNQFISSFIAFGKSVGLEIERKIGYKLNKDSDKTSIDRKTVREIIGPVKNKKHKTILTLLYYGALLPSEMISIKLVDYNESTSTIIINSRNTKVIHLNESMKDYIERYLNEYKPVKFLFEGVESGTSYSVRSIQQLIINVTKKKGVKVSARDLKRSRIKNLLQSDRSTEEIYRMTGFKVKI
ncbi:hypothetical protein CEQ90_19975 [Lewinellaceae bacterium SD302]|nr:hypothetical protein CEQ90_19975 [Lewinellaceae bacterium SD302]